MARCAPLCPGTGRGPHRRFRRAPLARSWSYPISRKHGYVVREARRRMRRRRRWGL